ncbi:alpha-keto acid decarboxylase family protein [Agromyces mariniharenae]|uniref:Alpha-keto-acid decarboxylase n=1 Tax=Agromyces mariniharenae TaxID=2604423 RepID=A0A5S4V188_9MICO|nr:thiamine pyrophosphate-binding protein [Agromyces mariniharenae]TYL52954.1 alpha-keto acid decarboxylase family protein [Agromyces mariniharenae]
MEGYTIADYLLDRLSELGVRHLFGVPGDFTLGFLDHVEAHEGIEWVGCANELNAGYAADGYARMHGLGALSTTFGVGELSAVNAVAGSYAEHVPVVHVVGAPTTAVQSAGRATHHTLGDGDFGHFARMAAEVTATQAVLTATDAASQIDRALVEVRDRRLPGYLMLPADVAETPAAPPTAPLEPHPPVTDPAALQAFRAALVERMSKAERIAVLADILVHRLDCEPHLHRLLDTGVPHATLLWGRRVVDESALGYLGSYLGEASDPEVRDGIESADLLVMSGVQFTDLTSGFFSQRIDPERTVEIRGEATRIGGTSYQPLAMGDALDAVTEAVVAAADSLRLAGADSGPFAGSTTDAATAAGGADTVVVAERAPAASDALGQEQLWHEVAASIRTGDVVLCDVGTAYYGMANHRLPHGVTFVGQPLWAAIGFTLPALLGAALARPDLRPVLLIGDGAAQLTIAELGTLLRHRIPAIVVVVDNDGYTIERVIHGPTAAYNDIAQWDWTALVSAFGRSIPAVGVRAETVGELRDALESARTRDGLTLVQAVVPRDDVPPTLDALGKVAAAANRRTE